MASVVESTYGTALFELSQELNLCEEITQDFQAMIDVLHTQPDFVKLMNSPQLDKQVKKQLFDEVFQGNVETVLLNFVKLLIDKNRVYYVFDIQRAFMALYYEHRDIEVVQLTSAHALDEAANQRIVAMLETKLNKKVKLVCSIDESLIAGIRIKVKDQVIDNTVLTRLTNMKKQVVNPN